MNDTRLILHVGAPKCASSSLQIALSQRPEFEARSGRERFRYAAITQHGELIAGDAVRLRATSLICRYANSVNADEMARFDETRVARLAHELSAMLVDSSIILSCESWIDAARFFHGLGLLDRIGSRVQIIAFVRPQADFVNACWWQWAAWADGDFQTWLYFTGFGKTCAWADFLSSWSTVAGVTSVCPRLLSKDIVADFFEELDCDHNSARHFNRSLPETALRFLQRHREFRLGMHDSDMDFILERALGDWHQPVPWVLPFDFLASFIAQRRPENERLIELLTASDQSAMLADPRWWDSNFYLDRPVVSPDVTEPQATESDAFAAALATALRDAERELCLLRSYNLPSRS